MDLRGFRMIVHVGSHPEYRGLGDYFGTGKPRPRMSGIRRTLDEWVGFAEALAKEHDGILPCVGWLCKNHPGLAHAMREHPKRFEHIPQDKPYGHRRTLEQSVIFAEALAEEHGGVLPSAGWIQKHHRGLARVMRKHPKRFKHIPQERLNRTLEAWVVFAEALAEEHGGILPCVKWIQKHHSGLDFAIRKHPKLFSGLRQEVQDNQGRVIGYRVLGEEKEAG